MQQSSHFPQLYAQACPDEPVIPSRINNHVKQAYQDQIQNELSRTTMVKMPKWQSKPEYPNIIKGKRVPYHHSFQALERERENKSMKDRVFHVKNMQQRRKDRNDVIVYPSYFFRGQSQTNDVRIDRYVKKALNNTEWEHKQKQFNRIYRVEEQARPRHRKQLKKYQYNLKPMSSQSNKLLENNPEQESEMPTPAFKKIQLRPLDGQQLPYNAKINIDNLPENDIRSILDFIYQHLLHREGDLQALKSRMCHAYGKEQVHNTWKLSMRLLQRDI